MRQPAQSPGLGNAGDATEEALVWKVWVFLFCFVFLMAFDYGNNKTYIKIEGWYNAPLST